MAAQANGLLYLDRNGFLLFSDSINKTLQFNFAPTLIRDLEIINQEELEKQINAFVTQTGLQPFSGSILLSENLLFKKPFTSPQDERQKQELKIFLDNLPFQHIGSIIFVQNNESQLIATNKELYMGLIKSFAKKQCEIQTVIPAYLVNVDLNQMVSLTPPLASDIIRRVQSFKQYSYLTSTSTQTVKTQAKATPEKKEESPKQPVVNEPNKEGNEQQNSSRVYLLLGVFVVLLIVLGVVAFTML